MTRLAFAFAGIASAAAALTAAAIIWLWLTEPAAVVNVVGSGQYGSVLRVVAALLISAVARLVRLL